MARNAMPWRGHCRPRVWACVFFQSYPCAGHPRKKRLLGNNEKGSWLERTTSLSIECTARAGALSSLLGALFAAFGLFFHHGELDFALHVVNAVNDNANFVADVVCLLGSRADDLACILVVRVIIVGQGVKRH